MTPEAGPSGLRSKLPVLLVILGGLGDWCIRRVLQHAQEFERESNGTVATLVIDIHPLGIASDQDSYEQWMDSAQRWIVRRLIEQTAEEVDQPIRDAAGDALKNPNWGFTHRLPVDPMLPDPSVPGSADPDRAISDFVALLGPVFQAAYQGDDTTLAQLVEARMEGYLDEIEESLSRNPDKTREKLARHWPLKRTEESFNDIRLKVVDYVADEVRERAGTSRRRINDDRAGLMAYLRETVDVGGTSVRRYLRSDPYAKDPDVINLFHCLANGDRLPVEEALLVRLAQEYRIIVYAATPPNTYPQLLRQWSPYAERIAFEKPIAGLLDQSEPGKLRLTQPVGPNVETTNKIRTSVAEALRNPKRIPSLAPLSLSSVDHYNSKWTVAAIEWLKQKKIVDHILDRPRRIAIQVLEGGMLPRGRFQFYNGVGGALADMLSHLIQPLRSLTGHATVGELLSDLDIVKIQRARYLLSEDFLLEAFGAGLAASKDLAEKLAKDTETFGVVHLKFKERWPNTDVFIRTGKGFLPQSKTMVIEAEDKHGAVALICDIERKRICLADHGWPSAVPPPDDLPAHVWMVTREFDVPGLIRDYRLAPDTKDYLSVFSALCSAEELDNRFFPSVEDASQVCDFFYAKLIEDRLAHPTGLEEPNVYQADYFGEEVRSWLASEAGWGQLGREKKGN